MTDRTHRTISCCLPAAAGVALVALLAGCQNEITDADIRNVTLTEVRLQWLDQREDPTAAELLLIDPRARADYEEARIPGAVHLTLPQLARVTNRDDRIDAYRRIVVYAEGPGAVAGRAMTKRLLVLGYGQARHFGGGLLEWSDAGFPVESGVPEDERSRAVEREPRRPVP
ncbi:MAG: rhodanese-like domain-containing protein [Planctomycetota bacterium]